MSRTYGSVLYQDQDKLEQAIWQALQPLKSVEHVWHEKGRYVVYYPHGDLEPTLDFFRVYNEKCTSYICYSGSAEFVAELRPLIGSYLADLLSAGVSQGYFGFNEHPTPAVLYFAGWMGPEVIDNALYVCPFDRSWRGCLTEKKYYDRERIRNIFPLGIVTNAFYDRVMALEEAADLPDMFPDMDTNLHPDNRIMMVDAYDRDLVLSTFLKHDLVVEEIKVETSHFPYTKDMLKNLLIPIFR